MQKCKKMDFSKFFLCFEKIFYKLGLIFQNKYLYLHRNCKFQNVNTK